MRKQKTVKELKKHHRAKIKVLKERIEELEEQYEEAVAEGNLEAEQATVRAYKTIEKNVIEEIDRCIKSRLDARIEMIMSMRYKATPVPTYDDLISEKLKHAINISNYVSPSKIVKDEEAK